MRGFVQKVVAAAVLGLAFTGCSAVLDFDSIGGGGDGGLVDTGAPTDSGEDTSEPVDTGVATDSAMCVKTNETETSCDGVDDDCNGQIDEGNPDCGASTVCHAGIGCLPGPVELAISPLHTCARRSDGTTDCWGQNNMYLVLPGSTELAIDFPTELDQPAEVVRISGQQSCIKPPGEQVRCWGPSARGLDTAAMPVMTPTDIVVPGTSSNATLVAPGGSHTCVGVPLNGVYCVGAGSSGQLGRGDEMRQTSYGVVAHTFMTPEDLVSNLDTTCALDDGEVYCWGMTVASGAFLPTNRPTLVDTSVDFQAISVGPGHVCGLGSDERAYCWGKNDHHQAFVADDPIIDEPTEQPMLPGRVSDIAAGGDSTCAIQDGHVICWGSNQFGVVTGSAERLEEDFPDPVGIPIEEPYYALDVEVGGAHACALLADRRILCWGQNTDGVLGRGDIGPGPHAPMEVGPRVVR